MINRVKRYINRIKNIKLFTISLFCVIVIFLYYFIPKLSTRYNNHGINKHNIRKIVAEEVKMPIRKQAFKGEKIVHIDLKGAPPKIGYYKELFPLLRILGATGILIEYEDMFPYSEKLVNISAFNSYTIQDIITINQLASEQNLKVIPLVPLFGHMEFLLKLPDYANYREVDEYPQVICPTYKYTEQLVESMIKQIITAHPDSHFIHIGADEVYFLGFCNHCVNEMMDHNLSKNQLFMTYINKIVGIVKKINPNLRILIWDDQLRSFTTDDLKIGNFNHNVEPVIWKYTKDVYDDLGPSLWDNYKKVFKNVWIASAFKGATGSNEVVSYVTHYLQNHRSWMYVVSEYQDQFNFEGIIITGWQRYDHFAVLCELFPVSLPTLAMCLRLLLGYNDSPLGPPTQIAKILKCDQPYALIGPVFGSPKCSFPGGDVLENIIHFHQLKQEFESIMEDSRVKGWMSEFNVDNCFSNRIHVKSVTSSLARIRSDLMELSSDLTLALLKIYDVYTVEEWKETYLKPFEKKVELMWKARNKLLDQKFWNRRPFN